jgi:hypothetical protein
MNGESYEVVGVFRSKENLEAAEYELREVGFSPVRYHHNIHETEEDHLEANWDSRILELSGKGVTLGGVVGISVAYIVMKLDPLSMVGTASSWWGRLVPLTFGGLLGVIGGAVIGSLLGATFKRKGSAPAAPPEKPLRYTLVVECSSPKETSLAWSVVEPLSTSLSSEHIMN